MTEPAVDPAAKWRTLLVLAGAESLAMSLWFSATAVAPALIAEWRLDAAGAAWLTMAVQLGFVVGALTSALFNVADLWPPRKVFAVGACVGAGLNALIPVAGVSYLPALILRFGTGMSLAAVYPVGMKIMATWTRSDRGLGLGILVGALTLGSASPHLFRAFGTIHRWQPVMVAASVSAVIGGLLVWRYGGLGPYRGATPPFRWSYLGHAFRVRSLRLANLGYLGHMWELYAMWTWLPAFLAVAYTRSGIVGAERAAAAMAFAAIAAGGVGSVLAGAVADRWGRTRTTIVSMALSGACAATIGVTLDHPWVASGAALLWGFAIVADSAQFSSAVSELGDREYMGTLLTTQTALGFLLTLVTIRLMPTAVDLVGWRWAFVGLALGPVAGIWAMARLRATPEAMRMAGGNR